MSALTLSLISMPTATPITTANTGAPHAYMVADIIPNTARSLLGVVEEHGHSAERLCRGLGFRYGDLQNEELLLSHQQIRTLIVRAQDLMGIPALGLVVGARQSPVSWGLLGLAMLTCETFGEAIRYGLDFQIEGGAMIDHRLEERGRDFFVEVRPRLFDIPIESYLVEESFAGALAVSRYLVGAEIKPVRIDLAYPRHGQAEQYTRLFQCPIRFDAGYNRMTLESHWLGARLPGYDRVMCGLVQRQLNSLLKRPVGRHDLLESVASHVRLSQDALPRQADMASQVNVSERTLRRRLGQHNTGYRAMRDATLYERARDLLQNSHMSINDISNALGYSDARAFRRAFKRWSGQLPTQMRSAVEGLQDIDAL